MREGIPEGSGEHFPFFLPRQRVQTPHSRNILPEPGEYPRTLGWMLGTRSIHRVRAECDIKQGILLPWKFQRIPEPK